MRAPQTRWPALRVLCLVFGSALLTSCGDDSGIEDAPSRRDAGVSGQGGAAAKGGRPASPPLPRGGESGSDRPALPPTIIECGTAVCVSPPSFGFVSACCADEATSICGVMMLNGTCQKPDPGDPRCPALNFRGIISLPSCCNDDQQCGLEGTRVGMPGCMDLEGAHKQARLWGVSGDEIPSPRPCDATSGTHLDAGIEDEDAGI